MRSIAHTLLVSLLLFVPAFSQGMSDAVFQAHGGAALLQKAQACEVRGTLERGDTKVQFVLKLQGENSRFETQDRVVVRRGMTEQSWRKGGPRGDIMPAILGNTEVYFLPFLAVSHLKKGAFQGKGLKNGHQVFSQRFAWQRFIGYEPDTPMLELDVDPETKLVSDLRFFTLEGNQTPVRLSYSGYFLVDSIAVPGRVEQFVNGVLLKTFLIESVTFGVSFQEDDFSITR